MRARRKCKNSGYSGYTYIILLKIKEKSVTTPRKIVVTQWLHSGYTPGSVTTHVTTKITAVVTFAPFKINYVTTVTTVTTPLRVIYTFFFAARRLPQNHDGQTANPKISE